MTGLVSDTRSAWRFLTANKTWTAVALTSLALGIGVNVVVFSLVESVLLRPFPYRDPDQVVVMWGNRSLESATESSFDNGISGPDVEDWRAETSTLASLAIYESTVELAAGTEAPVPASRVGPEVFNVLGVLPELGRTFLPSDRGLNVVILSYGFWQRRFGGDDAVIGQTLRVGTQLSEIIGVMPQGFFFPEHDVEFWIPSSGAWRAAGLVSSRDEARFRVVGRLQAGVSLEAAQAEIDVLNRRLDDEFPRTAANSTGRNERVTGVFRINEVVVNNYRLVLWMLLGAVALVLLIACSNVANLLLARGAGRRKELALRATLGAGRLVLLRQLVFEGLLLSSVAGILALFIAYVGIRLVPGLRLVEIPRIETASMNWAVLLFALAVSVLAGLASGFPPALKLSRSNFAESLKLGTQATAPSERNGPRDLLVIFEIAVALILLMATGLLVRSSVELSQIDWGFDPENVTIMRARIPSPQSGWGMEFAETALEPMRTVPGVQSVSAGVAAPFFPFTGRDPRVVADRQPISASVVVRRIPVSPSYFRSLGIPVIGREFDERDGAGAPKTTLLSESLAEELFPDVDPLGRTVHFATLRENADRRSTDPNDFEVTGETAFTVIGVAGDVKMTDDPGADPAGPTIYVDYRQVPDAFPVFFGGGTNALTFILRSDGESEGVIAAARAAILTANPDAIFATAARMDDLVSQAIGGGGSSKLMLALSLVFGTLSLILAAVGVYGVMSYSVSQRTYEIGVRMAVGAEPSDVLWMVLKRGLVLTTVGLVIGLAGAWAGTRLLESYLFGITPTDPVTFAGVIALLLFVAVAATLIPARRASRVDPLAATRAE